MIKSDGMTRGGRGAKAKKKNFYRKLLISSLTHGIPEKDGNHGRVGKTF